MSNGSASSSRDVESTGWVLTCSLEHYPRQPSLAARLKGTDPIYYTFQLECGNETGFAHWQVYVEYDRKRTWSAMCRDFPESHIEARRGTPEEAAEYCQKDDTHLDGPWTYGTLPVQREGQGKRNDIHRLHAAVVAKRNRPSLWRDAETGPAMLKYWRGVYQMQNELGAEEKRRWKTSVYVVWGPPGVGKTHLVYRFADRDAYQLTCPPNRGMPVWWDGYHGQSDVIIDDYSGWIKWTNFLLILDERPCRVDYRGGSTQLLARRIFITSNREPERWYRDEVGPVLALTRRLTTVMEMNSRDDPVPDGWGLNPPKLEEGVVDLTGEE